MLKHQGIPFVIISARSPSGIYPIQEKYFFKSPIISYSGALILDEDGKILYSKGFSRELAKKVIEFIEKNQFDCSWNIYSFNTLIVKNKHDPRIIREENFVHAKAIKGTVDMLETVAMPFLMGNAPEELKSRFSNITESNDNEGLYHGLSKIGLVPET